MYICEVCGFTTHIKTHYRKHTETKKHKNNLEKYNKKYYNCNKNANNVSDISTTLAQNDNNNSISYNCIYCNKSFSTRSSKSRHQSKFCKQNDKVNVNKLMQLLNEKNEVIENKDAVIESKDKQIEELMKKLECQVMTNHGTIVQGNINNTANIQLLNYNKTDYDFLSDNDYLRCFMDNNHCVKKLIEKVHFNPNKPENMNVYISSMKGKYVMVYRDNIWQLKNRKQQIDDLYETNELVLEQWFDEYKEQYPDIIKSFTRYLKNKSKDHDLIRSVKDEVMLMLYNKRYLISD